MFVLLVKTQAQTPFFRAHTFPDAHKETKVKLLYQCTDGYVWLGTDKGLFRYDGLNFIPYFAPDSICNNRVSALYEDQHGKMWIGYEDGRIFYTEQFQSIRLWTPEEGLPVVPVTGFGEGADGNFWFSTYGEGLYFYRQNRMYNVNTDDGLGGNDVYQLHVDSLGRAWTALDNGIDICTISESGEKQIRSIKRSQGLPDDIVRTFLPDDNGNFWIGTYDGGICHLNIQSEQIFTPEMEWSYGTVNTLALFEGKELWIGTERQGLIRYDLVTDRFQPLSKASEERPNKVLDLLKDVEGNLWVSSQMLGLQSGNRQFEFIQSELENIQSVLVDHLNQLWVGTQDGLFQFNVEKNEYLSVLSEIDLNVLSLYEDAYQNIWIGTFGDGVYCLDPRSSAIRHLDEKNGLTNGSVLSIDGDGTYKSGWLPWGG